MAFTLSDVFNRLRSRRELTEQTDREKYLGEIRKLRAALQRGAEPDFDSLTTAAAKCGFTELHVREHLEALEKLRELKAKRARLQPVADRMAGIDKENKALMAKLGAYREQIAREQAVLQEETGRAQSAFGQLGFIGTEILDLEQKLAPLGLAEIASD